jgi:poly(3-hydroxyalkanoate) depolymerase
MTTEEPPEPGATGPGRRGGRLRAVAGGWRPGRSAGHLRTLTIRGRALRVAVREGDPRWPPLLLCNGIGASLELLQPFVDALSPQRGVVRFDLPGIGGSALPVIPYHMTTLAPMLSGLLDELGYEQADVLGISWGGGLAQQFAIQCPSRVRRLVLVATGTGSVMVPAHPRVLARMLTPRRHRDRGYAARIAGEIYGGSVRADPARAADLLHATTRLGPGRGYFYQLLAGAGWTSLPLLPLLRQPTLILAGDDDPIIPLVNARIMHLLITQSELTVYHGGHLDLVSESEQLAPVIEAFLNAGTSSADESTAAVRDTRGGQRKAGA